MPTALVSSPTRLQPRPSDAAPILWRDPHGVSPDELAVYIRQLEDACLANPQSANLRTCLGVAHAVNFDVYKSMDALEEALRLDADNFWAQLKYGELHYRLRALNRAEEETRRAIELAETPLQLALARQQMKEIRALLHTCVRNVHWTKPVTTPALVISAMIVLMFVTMMWK
jgi:cytochrome c-type biogenesis protein CcmH/NrfG